jgi:uridylate kinase
MDRVKADQIGMLATVMNCIYTADAFRRAGMKCKIMSPFTIGDVTELYVRDKAVEAMEAGYVVFYAGGSGHPFFSTDMPTVLRAVETECDVILSAKSIDGVYDSDPKLNPAARKYDRMHIEEVYEKKLGVIDLTASVMCMENHMPLMVFGLDGKDSIKHAFTDEFDGTYIEA